MTFSIEALKEIRKILESGWAADTSYLASEYTGFPKSSGQCYVTARTLNHVFGWQILFNGSEGNNHYWNRLPDGLEVDFTSDQVGGDGIFPVEGMFGKLRKFKPIDQCFDHVNPRLRRYLKRVEPLLKAFKERHE